MRIQQFVKRIARVAFLIVIVAGGSTLQLAFVRGQEGAQAEEAAAATAGSPKGAQVCPCKLLLLMGGFYYYTVQFTDSSDPSSCTCQFPPTVPASCATSTREHIMGCGEEGCKDPIFQYGGYKASSSYMGRVARRTPEGLLSYTVARTSRRKVPAAITPVTVEPDKILYETLASFDGKLFRVARCVLLDATKASYLIAHECEGDVSQGEIELDLVNNKVEIAKGNQHFPVGDSFDFIVEHRVGPAPFELERENQPEQNGEPTPADKENGNG